MHQWRPVACRHPTNDTLPQLLHIASDRSTTPGYKQLLMRLRSTNPAWKITVYNASARMQWMERCAQPDAIAAFVALRHEVMRTDLFRLAIIWATGGVYTDDKFALTASLNEFPLLQTGATFVCEKDGITTWFLASPPGNGAIGAILSTVLDRINQRKDECLQPNEHRYTRNGCSFAERVWKLTGPRIWHSTILHDRLGRSRNRTDYGCAYLGRLPDANTSKSLFTYRDAVNGELLRVWDTRARAVVNWPLTLSMTKHHQSLKGSYHTMGVRESLFNNRTDSQ